ncbi:MAG: DUF421 domain-containing protein [Clostridia bacterium]|nr:DUF421 domain-containing protein [Clostridia bacterium]
MGKRQIGQLQPHELVVALMIADLASMPMEDNSVPILNGVIPILALVMSQIILSFTILKSIRFRRFICGKSKIVIRQGKIDENSLRDEMYTVDDLTEALRIKGYNDIQEINQARLETNGELSVVPYGFAAPAERCDVGSQNEEPLRVDVIIAGTLLEDNISAINIDIKQLNHEIKKAGANSVKDVLYANAGVDGEFFIQLKSSAKRR